MFGSFTEENGGVSLKGMICSTQLRAATVTVFGGAKPGHDPRLSEAAAELGREIATAGMRLVYGGGSDGLMGSVAVAAVEAGGEVVAVAPDFLIDRMRMPEGLAQVVAVPDMHMRKRLMFDYADAFVAMPGGIGTIEELAEVMTWRKLERHRKPMLLANFCGYWSHWIALLAHMEECGLLCGEVTASCLIAEQPAVLRDMLQRGVGIGTSDLGASKHANRTFGANPA